MQLPLAHPELVRDAGDPRRVRPQPLRRGDHQRVGRHAAPCHRGEQQPQPPARIRLGHGRLEPCGLLAPDERGGDLAVAQLGRRHAQERAGGARAQADAGRQGSRRQRHGARAGVRAGDHQLATGLPDQVDASVGHDPLGVILNRLVLPRARHDRLERGRRPVLAIRRNHAIEATRHRSKDLC